MLTRRAYAPTPAFFSRGGAAVSRPRRRLGICEARVKTRGRTMRRRTWAILAAAVYGAVALAWALSGPPTGRTPAADPPTEKKKKADAKPSGDDVFGLTTMHQFHLEIAAADWDKMQPTGGMR